MSTKKKSSARGGAKAGAKRRAGGGAGARGGSQSAEGGETPSDLYSLRQLAGILKVDRHRLAEQLAALESFPGPNRSRLYSLEAVEELLAEAADPQLAEARRRKLLAEAELAELRLGKERGELESRKEMTGRLISVFRAWRMRLAVLLPREISAQLHKAESPDHVAEILRVEVGRMLNEFREDHVGFINRTEGLEGSVSDGKAS